MESNSAVLVFIEYPMREFNLTKIFLDKVIRHVAEKPAKRVTALHLALGEISELDRASIQNHWSELSKGTLAEHAQLHFRLIPSEVQCMACFQKYQPVGKKIACPYCGSFGAKILKGEECHVESVDTESE